MISIRRTARLGGAALLALAVIGCEGPAATHPAVGRRVGPLPIVAIADVLQADATPSAPPRLEGRITLLNFWGTWCPPCRRELPGLVRLAGRLADEPRFQLIAVSCGAGDADEIAVETRDFLARQQFTPPLEAWAFADGLGATVFSQAYGLRAFPTTYLVGPDGRVRRVWEGYRPRDEAEMATAIVELLKAPAVAVEAAGLTRAARATSSRRPPDREHASLPRPRPRGRGRRRTPRRAAPA